MSEIRKTPKIRFEGFTNDWEQRKLGELGKAISGTGFPEREQGGQKGIPFYKISDMNIDGNEHEMNVANNYVTADQISNNHWNVINDVPAVLFAKVGAAVMLNRKRLCRFPFLLDNNSMTYVFDKKVLIPKYSKIMFEKIYLPSLVQVGALPSYNATQVENIEINIPNIDEQTRIGNLFYEIDNLITLHQRKYDKLVNVKKSMLEKMFPKNSEKVPEIRFKGFNDDWEQRKLNQFSKYITSNKTSSDVITDGLYDLYDANTIIGKTSESPIKEEYITIIKDGSGVGKVRRLPKDTLFIGTMGGIFAVNSNIDFVYCNLLKTDFTKEINGATIPHVYYSSYGNNEYFIPTIDEQNKIGEIFRNIDNLITLHQRKLEKLNNLKKSMLEKMFV